MEQLYETTTSLNFYQDSLEGMTMNTTSNSKDNISDITMNTMPPNFPECIHVIQDVLLGIFIVTTIVGFVGNTSTIIAILIHKQHRKSVATCFILNLAIADDLFILSLPFQAHSSYTSRWIFGKPMCAILNPFYGINLFASIFTMVLLSVDRYFAIKQPLKSMQYRRPRNAGLVCVVIWISSLIIVTPMWLYADVQRSCGTRMPVNVQYVWKGLQLILGLILPVIVMVVCYSHLIRHLLNRTPLIQDQVPNHVKRVTKMVLLVTVTFVVCWTPWHVLKYLQRRHVMAHMCSMISMNVVAQTLVFVSSCCNPFIYWISSRTFRAMYWTVLGQCCPRLQREQSARESMFARSQSIRSYVAKYTRTSLVTSNTLGPHATDNEPSFTCQLQQN